jgi:sigma-B regulation protein RsbU (phosphoserine phosphatase)
MPPSDSELGDLYENAPFAYILMRVDGRILKANATLANWTGRGIEEIVGKKLQDLLTVATGVYYEMSVAPLISAHGAFDDIPLDLKAREGGSLAVSASGTTRKAESGMPAVVRMAFLKAVERRRYERQLVSNNERSQGAERAARGLLDSERESSVLREQFIAVLGHDLRNPLASISGGLRLLSKNPPEDRRKLVHELLSASVVRMSVLIDNVLDFARGRLGAGIPLEYRQEIWLAPLLDHVVAELRIVSPNRRIETDFDLPSPVRCDPSRIGQLVSNLLGNALTHGTADTPVRVHADATDNTLTIWVANGGAPILPEAMEHLFQPFFRGHVRQSQQGLGLGLHIASEIAKAHGGTLTADSTPEETRFTFTMPISAN